ncbi:MAG: DUF4366 domain-containing protein [Christensenella sp.]|uniref:DUF4366 domain-containing protein n=1 Tax=Christensenella sp. TaxID=1935934 RepID=UPI002B20F3F8|nr:DUF4366 domain-containing protein [Christensenella sp.]MEA5004492.1 DUF4366 domain-containing protein [Christensenella sp.]
MKTKFNILLPLLALTLCLGAFLFPVTAYAQTTDTTPPTITATLSGQTLTVTAKDEDSGVDSIYVGKHRFTTLADGTARLQFKDYAGTADKQVEVYATDVAGNHSQSVLIDNPYYVAPATPTPAPATSNTTPASTQAPVAPTPASSSTPAPTLSASPAPTPSAALPEPQPPVDVTEDAIPSGSNPLTPNGGGTVQDNATGEEGKEFFTVTTEAGNVYYLIIDRQRGTQNVYFLSPVTEADLLALADSGAVTNPGLVQPEPQTPETPTPSEEPQPQQSAQTGNIGTILFVLLAIAAVGGAAYYIKIVKPRKQAQDEAEYEDDFEDEESGEEEYFFDGEKSTDTVGDDDSEDD